MQREIGSTFTYDGKEYKVCNSTDWCDGCDFYEADCSNIKLLGNCINRIFKEMKKFTKSDLKPGMVVEYANGNRRLVLPTKYGLSLIGLSEYLSDLSGYTEDLTHSEDERRNINKVYSINSPGIINDILTKSWHLQLLWERKEPKEYTIQEIADKLGIPVEELRIKK